MIFKFIYGMFQSLPKTRASNQLCSMFNATPGIYSPWSLTFTRNRMRYHFPHPNERMRIKKHGWHARMATLNGRKILMRRILKGKHVLSH